MKQSTIENVLDLIAGTLFQEALVLEARTRELVVVKAVRRASGPPDLCQSNHDISASSTPTGK